jgi:uncharacterized protein (TIGR03435 family)
MFRAIAAVALLASAAFAQTAPKLEFEVASVKVSTPTPTRGALFGCKGGPGTDDPTHLICGSESAYLMILSAYGINFLQLAAPEWLAASRFDISANVPAGATKEQVQEMWKNLLAERFHLEAHHETREIAQFDLVVSKNGAKLKSVAPADGPPKVPTLGNRRPDFTYLHFPKTTMAVLASSLSIQTKQLVNDATGLTGDYDVELSWRPDLATAGPDSPPDLRTAIHEQLGLELKPKKAPLEMIVVDRMEKTPSGN